MELLGILAIMLLYPMIVGGITLYFSVKTGQEGRNDV